MGEEKKTKKYFERDAKSIVDILFDNKLLSSDMSRDNMNSLEELIEGMMSGRFESYIKAEKLFGSLKSKDNV